MDTDLKPDDLVRLTEIGHKIKRRPPKGLSSKVLQAIFKLGYGHAETIHSLSIFLEIDFENTKKLVAALIRYKEVQIIRQEEAKIVIGDKEH